MSEYGEEMNRAVRLIMDNRMRHIEEMASAFLLQVGPAAVLDYELVEQRSENGLSVSWWFRRRSEPKEQASDREEIAPGFIDRES